MASEVSCFSPVTLALIPSVSLSVGSARVVLESLWESRQTSPALVYLALLRMFTVLICSLPSRAA